MKFGIIGSTEYKNKEGLIHWLEHTIIKDKDIIVSGHSPGNNYDNVDMWAEEWANNNCKNKPIIYPAKVFNRAGFFGRNNQIALESDILILFVNKFQYRSGAWNTLKYFLENNIPMGRFDVIDEDGLPWRFEELPNWVQNKLKAI